MYLSFTRSLWGNFRNENERRKFTRLALIFACMISLCALLHPLKDVLFLNVVGVEWLPYVRWISLIALIPALFLYAGFIDYFSRHNIFYGLCAVGSIVTLVFAGLVKFFPHQILGWMWYAFTEVFVSLFIALFWSFVADISTPEDAKSGYALIIVGAQCGAVGAPLLLCPFVASWGIIPILLIISVGLIGVGVLMYWFIQVTPAEYLKGFCYEESHKESSEKTGFLEGLKLIGSSGYLMGLALIISLCDMIITLLEYHVKIKAAHVYAGKEELIEFFFRLTLYANSVALLSLLLGFGAFARWLGVGRSLLLLPIAIAVGVVVMGASDSLMISMITLVCFKGISYALDKPTREQLYVPTSMQVKYKAKSWIDTFGSRLSKGLGSSVHMLRPMLQSGFIVVSSMFCLGFIGVWIVVAVYVARIYRRAIEGNELIC